MQELKTLIDRASKICGSDTALASRMGIKTQVVSMLRHGRPITPETAAELASIAGENARDAAIQAIVERAKGTRREGVLREILGKSLAAGVAAMLVFSYKPAEGDVNNSKSDVNKVVNTIYIVECLKAAMRRLFQAAHWVLRSNMGEPPIPHAVYQ